MPVFIPLDRVVDSPFQPRRHYDEAAVAELADSIERDGQLQHPAARLVNLPPDHTVVDGPGGVRLVHDLKGAKVGGVRLQTEETPLGNPRFVTSALEKHPEIRVQLAFGHRRARAWRLAWERHAARARVELLDASAGFVGLAGVPVGTMPVELAPLTDAEMFARAVAENRHRRDLSAVEEAEAMEAAAASFGWTHEQIGERFGYERSTVSNKLRLLKLPEELRQANREGRIPERTARALVPAFDLPDELAPHAHSQRLAYTLDAADVAFAVEGGETHDGLAAKVARYLDALREEAARVKAEREPALFAVEVEDEPRLVEPNAGEDWDDGPMGTGTVTTTGEAERAELMGERSGAPVETVGAPAAPTGAPAAPAWPEPVLPPEWEQLDRMTVKQLEDVRRRYSLYGFIRLDPHQVGDDTRKPAQLERTRRTLREVANLRAAVQLTDAQIDALLAHYGGEASRSVSGPFDGKLRELAPMPDEAWARYQRVMLLPRLVSSFGGYDDATRKMGVRGRAVTAGDNPSPSAPAPPPEPAAALPTAGGRPAAEDVPERNNADDVDALACPTCGHLEWCECEDADGVPDADPDAERPFDFEGEASAETTEPARCPTCGLVRCECADDPLARAEEEGREACRRGDGVHLNPYDSIDRRPERKAWARGWDAEAAVKYAPGVSAETSAETEGAPA